MAQPLSGGSAPEPLGRTDEAKKEAQTALQLNPKFTNRLYRAGAQTDNPTFLRQRERIIEALSAAGLPKDHPASP